MTLSLSSEATLWDRSSTNAVRLSLCDARKLCSLVHDSSATLFVHARVYLSQTVAAVSCDARALRFSLCAIVGRDQSLSLALQLMVFIVLWLSLWVIFVYDWFLSHVRLISFSCTIDYSLVYHRFLSWSSCCSFIACIWRLTNCLQDRELSRTRSQRETSD